MHTPTMHEQLAALSALPGAWGHPPFEEVDPFALGHFWHQEEDSRYRCSICEVLSLDPREVLLSCEDYLAQRHERGRRQVRNWRAHRFPR